MPQPLVRSAVVADAPTISAIYNHSVLHSTATYQERPESVDDRLVWLALHTESHPALVAEIDGAVVGWAALSPFHPRSAFRYTVESSVYIAESHQRRGLGRALMLELIARARAAGHHRLVATISGDQLPSLALHQALGFRHAGTLHEVGRKFDRWLDVVTMELPL
ncbi:MAG: N-acetyltransferase family protein [Verrucomicrobiales bacterium]